MGLAVIGALVLGWGKRERYLFDLPAAFDPSREDERCSETKQLCFSLFALCPPYTATCSKCIKQTAMKILMCNRATSNEKERERGSKKGDRGGSMKIALSFFETVLRVDKQLKSFFSSFFLFLPPKSKLAGNAPKSNQRNVLTTLRLQQRGQKGKAKTKRGKGGGTRKKERRKRKKERNVVFHQRSQNHHSFPPLLLFLTQSVRACVRACSVQGTTKTTKKED